MSEVKTVTFRQPLPAADPVAVAQQEITLMLNGVRTKVWLSPAAEYQDYLASADDRVWIDVRHIDRDYHVIATWWKTFLVNAHEAPEGNMPDHEIIRVTFRASDNEARTVAPAAE